MKLSALSGIKELTFDIEGQGTLILEVKNTFGTKESMLMTKKYKHLGDTDNDEQINDLLGLCSEIIQDWNVEAEDSEEKLEINPENVARLPGFVTLAVMNHFNGKKKVTEEDESSSN